MPAHNEENYIIGTLDSLLLQDYQGPYEIIAIDNNSTDNTFSLLNNYKSDKLILLQEKSKGKSYALNQGLSLAKYDFILCLDADTYLLPNAITELMTTFLSSPSYIVAVAGSIYVRNSRTNFMTRIQEWDYFHAIAAVKRVQSLFQATLVAQGAFSLFKKECILELGGWKHVVGEDIVLTWGLLEKKHGVSFSEDAIAFTNVPETYSAFFKQRSRWARGMLEAFRAYPGILLRPKLITFLIYWNLLFPVIDMTLVFIFIPGVIAAFFGYYFIAGPMTVAILPLTMALNLITLSRQKKMFTKNHLIIRSNFLGFIGYTLFYNLLMSPASIYGYFSELMNFKKNWGTK